MRNPASIQDGYIISEVFQVDEARLPRLYTYEIRVHNRSLREVGGRLAVRVARRFKGRWVWSDGLLVSDVECDAVALQELLRELWESESELFGSTTAIYPVQAAITAKMKADFVAQGVFKSLYSKARQALERFNETVGDKVVVRRVHEVRGWVVDGQPAVSISVESSIEMIELFADYVRRLSHPEGAVGLYVGDLNGSLTGEIEAYRGLLAQERERLVRITSTDATRQILENSPDDTPVYSVWVGRSRAHYDYAATALKIVVRLEDCPRLGIDASRLLGLLRLAPQKRLEMVRAVYDACRREGCLGQAFVENRTPTLFRRASAIGFSAAIEVGDRKVVPVDNLRVDINPLKRHGLYRLHPRYGQQGRIMRIEVVAEKQIGALPDAHRIRLERELKELGVQVSIAKSAHTFEAARPATLDRAVAQAIRNEPDLILALMPDAGNADEEDSYTHFKRLTVSQGVPSQVIQQSTLRSKFNYALNNLLLGVLGKTGNVPFVLAQPLEFADMIVGIDIARQAKSRLPGSVNATAIARIYYSSGEFLRYAIHDVPLEGETIPSDALLSLFPAQDFGGKRVIIHRDGHFRGDERQALHRWASQIGVEFYLLEIIKNNTPRIYLYATASSASESVAESPEKGFMFRLSEQQAFLVSTPQPFKDATPRPIHLISDGRLTIEQYAQSVLALTLLHYGSQRQPRLPVTIHYSDRIAYLALQGVKPKNLEGDVPYWL